MATPKETICEIKLETADMNPNKKSVNPLNIFPHFSRTLLFFLILSNSLFAQIASYRKAEILYFFSRRDCKPKQWGGANNKKTGRLIKGRTWDELPRFRKTG